MLERLLSGGQTGVDRAALDAALERGLPCGGWCPKGRRAEDGRIPDDYPLEETDSAGYRDRTLRNVLDSDGTLILMTGALTGGTALTRELAIANDKPVMVVDLDSPLPAGVVGDWLERMNIRRLNVAGPRESQRPGIGLRARDFLEALLYAAAAGDGKRGRRD